MDLEGIQGPFKGLIEDSQVERFEMGQLLMEEGSSSTTMFILLQGTVRVFKNYGKSEVPLATLGAGEIVGELALFGSRPRSASVAALTPVIALKVETNGLRDKISPAWIVPVLQVVAQRLKHANQALSTLKNINEFSKKSFNRDISAGFIVKELSRYVKTLCTYINDHNQNETESAPLSELQAAIQDTDESLQSELINQRAFERAARYSGLITHDEQVLTKQLYELRTFLDAAAKKENIRLPSISCLQLIEELISHPKVNRDAERLKLDTENNPFQDMPLYADALADYKRLGFVHEEKKELVARLDELMPFWFNMKFIKVFDFSDIGV